MPFPALPTSLPPIDRVDIVDLTRVDDGGRVDEYMGAAGDAPSVRLIGADADRVATLWRKLPPGESMRCHVPPFGLRFYAAGRLLCEASVCWKCNNVFGEAGGSPLSFEFDGLHPLSRALLTACERAVGRPAAE